MKPILQPPGSLNRGQARNRLATMALFFALLSPISSWGDDEHRATCAGYIGTMDAAVKSGDPLGPQAYINLADTMYRAINKGAVQHHMAPLPLPDDEDSEAKRAMVVVAECKLNPSAKYFEAVSFAYIELRRAAGLSVTIPPQ